MPHSKEGTKLEVGDRVTIEATVKSIMEGADYCNVTVETVEAMWPGDSKTAITLNGKQLSKPPAHPEANHEPT